MIVVELTFDPDRPERLAARADHRDVLARLHAEGLLVAAGPWADDTGALLLFDTDATTVDRVLAQDPYYGTPGVRSVEVREWSPVVQPESGLRAR